MNFFIAFFLPLRTFNLCNHHPHLAPKKTITIDSVKYTYINDDGSYIPTTEMYPTVDADGWKQFDELTDEKGNLFIPFGGFIVLYLCCLDSEERPNEYGQSPKYILPLNQPINPVSPYPQQAPVSPYPQPMAQPVSPYPQPNPVPPQPYMAPPPGPYPQQYPTQGNLYPQ